MKQQQKQIQMNSELLKQVEKKLTVGDVTTIAKAAKVSKSTVSQWIKGVRVPKKEAEIMEIVAKLINEKKERLEKAEKSIKEAINNL